MELTIPEAFVDTVDDLRKRSVMRGTQYDAVQAAGLMRRLLLDGQRLVDQGNSWLHDQGEPFLRPTFRWVAAYRRQEGLWIGADSMDPTMIVGEVQDALSQGNAEVIEGGREQFLSTVVIRSNDETVTASALISCYANRRGGTHVDLIRDTDSDLLKHAINQAGGRLVRTIATLGRITVAGLDSLAVQIHWRLGG